MPGSQAHDEILFDRSRGFVRPTNRAGGLEGGMTNGEQLVVRAAMKPIPTLMTPLASVDLDTLEPVDASRERSDVCAVPAAAVVAEAEVAFVLARAYLDKFGRDSMADIVQARDAYLERLRPCRAVSHLLLIGFMGAGKSTVGRLAADRLELPFVDLDTLVQDRDGRSVRQIFEQDGEPAFRALETAALESLESMPPSVVACGGGVVLSDANRVSLKRLGTVVYLRVTAAETLARVGDDGTRPLLAGAGGALVAGRLLEAREALYSAIADAVVDTVDRTPDEVAEQVVLLARERSVG